MIGDCVQLVVCPLHNIAQQHRYDDIGPSSSDCFLSTTSE
jgi:hypothetical protein